MLVRFFAMLFFWCCCCFHLHSSSQGACFLFSRAMCINQILFAILSCCFSFTPTLPLNVFVSFGALSLLC